MSRLLLRHTHLLLDTCCVINLHATGLLSEILGTLPVTAVVPEDVRQEIKHFEIESYVAEGVLVPDDFTGNEYDLSVRMALATRLGDGEIAVSTLAISRTWAIATDEKKVHEHLQRHAPDIQQISTTELLRHWADVTGPSSAVLRAALRSIESRGRFIPGPYYPFHQWWRQSCDDEEE